MKYPLLASAAVRVFERIPTLVWAAWIVGVVAVTGAMALNGGPVH
jgi:hypothetical protein